MSRYIDADAIKLEKGFFEKVDNVPKFYEWLGKQPTVDAVPVVHSRYVKGNSGEWYCLNCMRIDDKYSVARYCWCCGAKMDGAEVEK